VVRKQGLALRSRSRRPSGSFTASSYEERATGATTGAPVVLSPATASRDFIDKMQTLRRCGVDVGLLFGEDPA
jgi:hypothetical protein